MKRKSEMKSWLVEELIKRSKSDTDLDALAAKELERLRAERDHWRDLVSVCDRRMFPFKQHADG